KGSGLSIVLNCAPGSAFAKYTTTIRRRNLLSKFTPVSLRLFGNFFHERIRSRSTARSARRLIWSKERGRERSREVERQRFSESRRIIRSGDKEVSAGAEPDHPRRLLQG